MELGYRVSKTTSSRVSDACIRCRRQKLKCDTQKPCTLCQRAGVACQPRSTGRRARTTSSTVGIQDTRQALDSQLQFSYQQSDPMQSVVPDRDVHAISNPSPESASAARDTITNDSKSPDQHLNRLETTSFGANTSAMGFAINVFGETAQDHPSCQSSIPNGAEICRPDNAWALRELSFPPTEVMNAMLDVYFDRMHWFIFIFHKPSFWENAQRVMTKSSWRADERGTVLATLMVAAFGLQIVVNDATWAGHEILSHHFLRSQVLLDSMISEVRLHLLELLDDCRLETVQVCILLGTFYIYHGSPNLAWSILGMSTRTAYALALHTSVTEQRPDGIRTEVGRRCWNHLTVADTFASMIYGRPTSLDSAFAKLHQLSETEDTALCIPAHLLRTSPGASGLTFHELKYELYGIISDAMSRFRLLPRQGDSLLPLIQAVSNIESSLSDWRGTVPPVLDLERWQTDPAFMDLREQRAEPAGERRSIDILFLQSAILQIIFDSSIILFRRTVLSSRMSTLQTPGGLLGESGQHVAQSLDVAVQAALRLSNIPIEPFKKEASLSFVCMHLFTAGTILSIPPAKDPFSEMAQRSKLGLLRIIKVGRGLKGLSKAAKLMDKLLTRLLTVATEREIENSLDVAQSADLARHTGETSNRIRGGTTATGQESEHDYVGLPSQSSNIGVAGAGSATYGEHATNLQQSQPSPTYPTPRTGTDTGYVGTDQLYPTSYSWFSNNDLEQLENNHLEWAFGAFGQAMFNLDTEL